MVHYNKSHRARLRELKKAHGRRLMHTYPGVVGVGISPKERGGVVLDHLALTIYVEKKLPAAAVAPAQRIDRDTALLADVGLDDLDIKEMHEIRALSQWPFAVARPQAFTKRYRPVWTGASEGHYLITAGTGSVLLVNSQGTRYRLSNNHVYADQNHGRIGDPIYQPGPYDGGEPIDQVGVLHFFEPLNFGGGVNYIDAALRSAAQDEVQAPLALNVNPTGPVQAEVGMSVVKSGRTTEVTRGQITDVDLTISVGYGGDLQAIFEDQILVSATSAFSQPGDSGSAVFQDVAGLPWIGLLFAGDEFGGFTIVNHATVVATHFGMELAIGGEIPEPPENGNGGGGGCNPFARIFGR